MPSPRGHWMAPFAAWAVLLLLAAAQRSAPSYKAPRTADGKPNLNGIWQALNTANWDLQGHSRQARQHPGAGRKAPSRAALAWSRAAKSPTCPPRWSKRKRNCEHRHNEDPEIKCYQPGVPRATYEPFPSRSSNSKNIILISYEFANASGTIYMENPRKPDRYLMGHSSAIGRATRWWSV